VIPRRLSITSTTFTIQAASAALCGGHAYVKPVAHSEGMLKWLTRITLAERRAPGSFTTRGYNDPVLDGFGRETGRPRPVWSIATESLIVSPAPKEVFPLADAPEIWGWAWADGGV
jgi:hypothetical protein